MNTAIDFELPPVTKREPWEDGPPQYMIDSDDQRPSEPPSGAHGRRLGASDDTDAEPAPPREWKTPAQRARELGRDRVRLTTGFSTLDVASRGGVPAGRIVVFAGPPGSAKTTLVTDLGVRWAKAGALVAILAADEEADGVLIRIGQQLGFERALLERGDSETREPFAEALARLPLLLIDAEQENAAIEDVAVELLRRRHDDQPIVLIGDSVQRMRALGSEAADSPRERVDAVMGALRKAAREGVCVVVTSEVSRGFYRSKREQIDPLAAGKESSGIEYAATMLIAMLADDDGIECVIAKNRLGEKPSFRVTLDRDRATMAEVPLSEEQRKPALARFNKTRARILDVVRTNPNLKSASAVYRHVGGTKADVLGAIREMETDTGELTKVGGCYRAVVREAES